MNKAFVREPEFDGRAWCPRCETQGTPVSRPALDTYIRPELRGRLGESAWFCSFPRCEVVYFDLLESMVTEDELTARVYPKDFDAPMCPCFGFTRDDVEADVADGVPTRIRHLLTKTQSDQARCRSLAVDGQCCIPQIQRLYVQLRSQREHDL